MRERENDYLKDFSVIPPSLRLSHFHNCERQNKITPRQWIIRKFMKRDECDGALHEIPMREAPQRSKCYILISTVTLCYSPYSPEGHIIEYEHTAWCGDTDNPRMQARAGERTRAGGVPPQRAGTEGKKCCHTLHQSVCVREYGVLALSPVCWHAVCIFGRSGGQWKCVHDSDTVVTQCVWVSEST